ncbi:MAG: polymer-forming cytoskeletal protein [Pseudomonadota bacterium]
MLGKSKDIKEADAPAIRPSAPAEKTIITKDISIEGEIRGKEDLVIEGAVKGSIQLEGHHLTIGPRGQVEAEVNAENVTISGRLIGNIKALGKVEITREANFNGEIKAKNLSVEDGAYLKAMIELEPHQKIDSTFKVKEKKGYGDDAAPALAGEPPKVK